MAVEGPRLDQAALPGPAKPTTRTIEALVAIRRTVPFMLSPSSRVGPHRIGGRL